MEAPKASAELVGTTIAERYRLDALIGEGGMGAVFQATHLLMRKRVAVKLLHADLSHDEEVLGRFRREAQAAARIEHPNVAAATDFGQLPDGSFYLVLEFVEGTSLMDVIRRGPIDAARALHIARQIGVALEKAHEAGVIHRDLKPDNIMLIRKDADPDFVKVLDFGIAKIEPGHAPAGQQLVTRYGTILGTPEYMSPEQAAGEAAGPPADLYSVGVMLYEMLTQKLPFDDKDRTKILSLHIIAPPPKMEERAPGVDVPAPVERLVMVLLAKEAKDRPAPAAALRAAIESAALEAGLTLPHLQSARTLPRSSDPGPAPESARWKASDALAQTQVGLSAESVSPASPRNPNEYKTTPAAPMAIASSARTTGIPGLKLGPLDGLPRPLAIAALGAPFFIVAFIIVVVISLVSHHPPPDPGAGEGGVIDAAAVPKPESTASWAKIAAAKAGGLADLEKLLAQYPDDDNVQAVLAESAVLAAQKPETQEDAFAILENELGARGVDGLMELSTGTQVTKLVKQRATQDLKKTEIRAKASPAALVVLDLRAAQNCASRHDVLPRAKESGDTRALTLLKPLKYTRGCGVFGRSDCNPCMRRDTDLEDAISAIESRAPAPKPSATP